MSEKDTEGWWITSNIQYLITAPMMRKLLQQIHEGGHMGAEALIANVPSPSE